MTACIALLARKGAEGGERIRRRRLWERRTINPSGNHTNKTADNEVLLPGVPGGTVYTKFLPVAIHDKQAMLVLYLRIHGF